jgi:hypothetical protein
MELADPVTPGRDTFIANELVKSQMHEAFVEKRIMTQIVSE